MSKHLLHANDDYFLIKKLLSSRVNMLMKTGGDPQGCVKITTYLSLKTYYVLSAQSFVDPTLFNSITTLLIQALLCPSS